MRTFSLFLLNLIGYLSSETGADNNCVLPSTSSTTFTTPPTKNTTNEISLKCPSGWKMFSRQIGEWCMMVNASRGDQEYARWKCWLLGAKLSGIENQEERNWIIARGEQIMPKDIKQGALWIGSQRREQCAGDNENDLGCVPWGNNAYEWIDEFTTGKYMMTWAPGQPDYHLRTHYCVQMTIVNTTNSAASGDLIDVSCVFSPEDPSYVLGYVCGKQATSVYL